MRFLLLEYTIGVQFRRIALTRTGDSGSVGQGLAETKGSIVFEQRVLYSGQRRPLAKDSKPPHEKVFGQRGPVEIHFSQARTQVLWKRREAFMMWGVPPRRCNDQVGTALWESSGAASRFCSRSVPSLMKKAGLEVVLEKKSGSGKEKGKKRLSGTRVVYGKKGCEESFHSRPDVFSTADMGSFQVLAHGSNDKKTGQTEGCCSAPSTIKVSVINWFSSTLWISGRNHTRISHPKDSNSFLVEGFEWMPTLGRSAQSMGMLFLLWARCPQDTKAVNSLPRDHG